MENEFTTEDELKAENELLRLKLEMEHGMLDFDTGQLKPEIENQWLNYIYDYEQVYKDAKQVKVIEYIGNPTFKKINELAPEEISAELDRLCDLMVAGGVRFTATCDYDDELIYRFITEELFEEEMADIRLDGTLQCFNYEEFHPNHDYDLRRYSDDFLRWIFEKTWTDDHAKYEMIDTISFQGKDYDGPAISQIIFAFQEEIRSFEVEEKNYKEVAFDLLEYTGHVVIQLSYVRNWNNGNSDKLKGDCHLYFKSEYGGWSLSGFGLPGLGN
jgi:hypothetical protein